ncbi:protein of unknown function [Pararobbsia alpina]
MTGTSNVSADAELRHRSRARRGLAIVVRENGSMIRWYARIFRHGVLLFFQAPIRSGSGHQVDGVLWTQISDAGISWTDGYIANATGVNKLRPHLQRADLAPAPVLPILPSSRRCPRARSK